MFCTWQHEVTVQISELEFVSVTSFDLVCGGWAKEDDRSDVRAINSLPDRQALWPSGQSLGLPSSTDLWIGGIITQQHNTSIFISGTMQTDFTQRGFGLLSAYSRLLEPIGTIIWPGLVWSNGRARLHKFSQILVQLCHRQPLCNIGRDTERHEWQTLYSVT